MPDSTTTYIIRADDILLANGIYYMSKPFYEYTAIYPEDDFEPCDAIAYHWATHPTGAQQYASEAEAQEVIRGLPNHSNPEVIPYNQALDEHIGLPAAFPFNVKSMPSDEDIEQGDYREGPAEKYIPFSDPPV